MAMSVGATSSLTVQYCFGISPSSVANVLCTEERALLYVCGAQVVVLNTETKEQAFISGGKHGISALHYSRRVIAVAERGDPVAQVCLFDATTLRKKKSMSYPDMGSGDFKSVSLSDDGKLCIAQGGAPDWSLVLWNVEKGAKVMGAVKVPVGDDGSVLHATFCPWDPSVVIALGRGVFKLYRISEGQMRPATLMVRREQASFLCFCWLDDNALVVGTEAGEVLLLVNLEFRAVLFPPAGETPPMTPIYCFGVTSTGALLAGSSGGTVRYLAKSTTIKDGYLYSGTYHVRDVVDSIRSICVNSDDSFVVATSNQQLFNASINHLNAKKDSSAECELLLTSFHGPGAAMKASITGMDVALWRNILVTCGKDRTLRVWNLSDHKVEIMKTFDEQPHSVSVHPTGTQLVVGFDDRVRLVSLLLMDLFVTKELPVKACSSVKFATGGQCFAAVSGFTVQVFSTHTVALLTVLKGHLVEVVSLSWTCLDSRLVTAGSDGTVFTWEVAGAVKGKEEYLCAAQYSGGVSARSGSHMYFPCVDARVRVITTDGAPHYAAQTEGRRFDAAEVELPRRTKCAVLDETRMLLYLGTSEEARPGAVLVAAIGASASGLGHVDVNDIAGAAITAMCLSPDGSTLFCGDDHGCIVICDVDVGGGKKSKQSLKEKEKEEALSPFELLDEVLIHYKTLEASKETIGQLEESLRELILSNEYQLVSREMQHAEHVRELGDAFKEQLRSEQIKCDMTEEERVELEFNYSKRMAAAETASAAEMASLESKYSTKIAAEKARHEALMAEIASAEKQWDRENHALLDAHEKRLSDLSSGYADTLQAENSLRQSLIEECLQLKAEYVLRRANLEEDAEVEIAGTKSEYELKLARETQTNDELISQYNIAKKELHSLQKELEMQREECKKLKDKESRLLEMVRSHEKDIQAQKKEIREREESVTDKEKRIFDLKKKNQELEKFRFVLDYKIKELKQQIAPREAEIASMRRQIEEMDLELEQYHKSNQALTMMISELDMKYEGLKGEHHSQTSRLRSSRMLQNRILRDLSDLANVRDDKVQLKARFVELFRTHVQEASDADVFGQSAATRVGDTDDPRILYNRDRDQMERNLESVRRALKTDTSAHRRDFEKMMRENVVLTRELNELRREHHEMTLQKDAVDAATSKGYGNVDLTALMELLGIGLPTTVQSEVKKNEKSRSKSIGSAAKGGGSAVYREVDMQNMQMKALEADLRNVCAAAGTSFVDVLAAIDRQVLMQVTLSPTRPSKSAA